MEKGGGGGGVGGSTTVTYCIYNTCMWPLVQSLDVIMISTEYPQKKGIRVTSRNHCSQRKYEKVAKIFFEKYLLLFQVILGPLS